MTKRNEPNKRDTPNEQDKQIAPQVSRDTLRVSRTSERSLAMVSRRAVTAVTIPLLMLITTLAPVSPSLANETDAEISLASISASLQPDLFRVPADLVQDVTNSFSLASPASWADYASSYFIAQAGAGSGPGSGHQGDAVPNQAETKGSHGEADRTRENHQGRLFHEAKSSRPLLNTQPSVDAQDRGTVVSPPARHKPEIPKP